MAGGDKKKGKKCDYALGKIYAIRSSKTPFYYVGSTTEHYLSARLGRHVSDYMSYNGFKNNKGYMTSFFVIEQDDYEIVLLEEYPCQNKIELKTREAYHILAGGENVCNKNIPNRTMKQWRLDNKERLQEYKRKYMEKKKQEKLAKL